MLLAAADLTGYIMERHRQQVRALVVAPMLAIAVVGEAANAGFIRAKRRYGEEIGAAVTVESVDDQAALLKLIQTWNEAPAVTGLIVQLPLPTDFDTDAAVAAITATKDVDGLREDSSFESATAKGIMWLLSRADVNLKTARVCVVGQGQLVGQPVAAMLEASGATVVRCDISTVDLTDRTKAADVIISGVGRAGLITSAMVKSGAVVIDAGTSLVDGRPVGDADPALYDRADIIITPVPGGVGPMTVAALFDSLLIAAG